MIFQGKAIRFFLRLFRVPKRNFQVAYFVELNLFQVGIGMSMVLDCKVVLGLENILYLLKI